MPEVKKKLKCFWCGRMYVDLIGHTKRQHPGLYARSYDIEKTVTGYELMPLYVDPDLVKLAQRTTPLTELLPKQEIKKTSILEPVINKFKAWINKSRVKLAHWIGGQTLEDEEYVKNY